MIPGQQPGVQVWGGVLRSRSPPVFAIVSKAHELRESIPRRRRQRRRSPMSAPSARRLHMTIPTIHFCHPEDGGINGFLEKGFTLGLGDINFHRFEAKVGRFDTVFQQLTFFMGLQASIVRPDNPNDSIPIFERYTLGGANTVRGGTKKMNLGPKMPKALPWAAMRLWPPQWKCATFSTRNCCVSGS